MLHTLLRTLLAWGCLAVSATAAVAQTSRAFVVGINEYVAIGQLKKAVQDARSIAATLGDLGYEVTLLTDAQADRLPFFTAWDRFLASVQQGDTVVMYFSGHGLQIRGVNYLMPRDVPKSDHGEGVIREFSISFSGLLDALEMKKPKVSLHILDACRDNPFAAPDGKKSFGTPGGLADVKNVEGAFIMYSAGAQQQALDWLTESDPDPNSVYTRRLLPLLRTPGLSLVDIAKRVQTQVSEDARTRHFIKGKHIAHEQRPAYYDGIVGHFYPAGAPGQSGAFAHVPAKLPQPGLSAAATSAGVLQPASKGLDATAAQRAPGTSSHPPTPQQNVAAVPPGTPPPAVLVDPKILFGQNSAAAAVRRPPQPKAEHPTPGLQPMSALQKSDLARLYDVALAHLQHHPVVAIASRNIRGDVAARYLSSGELKFPTSRAMGALPGLPDRTLVHQYYVATVQRLLSSSQSKAAMMAAFAAEKSRLLGE